MLVTDREDLRLCISIDVLLNEVTSFHALIDKKIHDAYKKNNIFVNFLLTFFPTQCKFMFVS